MKNYGKALLISVVAFGIFTGSASADTLAPAKATNAEVQSGDISTRATYYNPASTMKVGWSTFVMNGRLVIMSGAGVVSTDGLKITALKPGKATVYNYAANGDVYVHSITVTN